MDRFGGLTFPLRAELGNDPAQRMLTMGDPGLRVLGSYLATMLNAWMGEAAESLWPGYPSLPAEANLGATKVPVRRVFFFQPRPDRPFVQADLPALFLFRYGDKGKVEHLTSDTLRTELPISVWWVPWREEPETEKLRDTFCFAVGAAMLAAVQFGYNPAWVVDQDRELPSTIEGRIPTQTAAWTVTSFTGKMAGVTLDPPRQVQLQTIPSLGSYLPGKVTVTGIDHRGRLWSDTVQISSPNGGEVLRTLWRFRRVTQIDFPRMANTNGGISVGWAASPEAATGSRVKRWGGFSELFHRSAGEKKTVNFKVGDGTVALSAFELLFDATEDYHPDPAAHSLGGASVESNIVLPNGELFSTDTF